MKKLIFALLFIALLISSQLFAAPPVEVKAEILIAFNEDFPSASGTVWFKTNEVFIAHFTENGEPVKAFYNKDGSFICTYRNVKAKDLPSKLVRQVGKRFYPSTIKNILEIASKEKDKIYYFSLEGDKDYKVVRADKDAGIVVVKKLKKY